MTESPHSINLLSVEFDHWNGQSDIHRYLSGSYIFLGHRRGRLYFAKDKANFVYITGGMVHVTTDVAHSLPTTNHLAISILSNHGYALVSRLIRM